VGAFSFAGGVDVVSCATGVSSLEVVVEVVSAGIGAVEVLSGTLAVPPDSPAPAAEEVAASTGAEDVASSWALASGILNRPRPNSRTTRARDNVVLMEVFLIHQDH
jgi:hypothetical protein